MLFMCIAYGITTDNPTATFENVPYNEWCADEVRGELDIDARLNPNTGEITLNLYYYAYEYVIKSCGGTDLEKRKTKFLSVHSDTTEPLPVKLDRIDFEVKFDLSFTNIKNK